MTARRARFIGAAATLVLLAAAPWGQAAQTRSQSFFAKLLLDDRATSTEIHGLLRDGGGFVDRSIAFRDLTGDDRDDAVVRVHSGGAAGVVAMYVFSTDSKDRDSPLRAIHRSQRLVRGSTHLRRDGLSYRTATYSAGDELCCPSRIVETLLRWDDDGKRFRVQERREVTPEG